MMRVNFNNQFCDVYIGRPSMYGNPFRIGPDGTRQEVLERYEQWLWSRRHLLNNIIRVLPGKILGCHCTLTMPCHGDLLVRIANGYQLAFSLEI